MAETTTDPRSLEQLVKQNAQGLAAMQKGQAALTENFSKLMDKLERTPANGDKNQSQTFGAPWARRGEDPFTSRGFSFGKMIGMMSEAVQPEEAKEEVRVHNRLAKAFSGGEWKYDFKDTGPNRRGMRFLAPLCTAFLPEQLIDRQFRTEIKQMVAAGVEGADYGWMNDYRRNQVKSLYGEKALSWLNEFTGGALVAPPEMGELIELLRNKEALVNAGARVVPLPPQGRMKYPRQTSASTTYWVGENAPITESIVGTGEVTLQAKKLAILIKAPNELIRFASPAAEALLRDDMTKSLALGLDMAGLEGTGTDTQPRGLINMPNITTITSGTTGANGDTLVPQDAYRMVAAVEEGNSEFEGYVMRPKTLYKFYQIRADAVGQGDARGPFVFNLIREAGDGVEATIAGFPVTKSTQVSQVRAKGTSTSLTYIIGGMWSDLLIGMFGAIEFAATTMGDTSFANDQSWIRGILSADIQARHEVSFVLLDNLDLSIA